MLSTLSLISPGPAYQSGHPLEGSYLWGCVCVCTRLLATPGLSQQLEQVSGLHNTENSSANL